MFIKLLSTLLKIAMVVGVLFVILLACSKTKDPVTQSDCSNTPKSFSLNVNPIIQSTCATNPGCHGSGSTNGPGELLNYSEIFNARLAIRSAVSSGEMPLNKTISGADKSKIICWIDDEAPNN